MAKGIDYGLGQTNIDNQTGIRYGVINQNEVLQVWADSSEPYYGKPHCPKCGNEACEYDDDRHGDYLSASDAGGYRSCADYTCESCAVYFESENAFGDEPLSFTLDDGEYLAEQDSHGDIFITKSPYYTKASFCSPCAPGACYLTSPCDDGEKAYCFGHDWFDGNRAPYPVYRVDNDEIVEPTS